MDGLIVVSNSSLFLLRFFAILHISHFFSLAVEYISLLHYAGFCHVTCFGHWNMNKNDCNSSKSRLIAALPIDAYAFYISVTASRKTYPG